MQQRLDGDAAALGKVLAAVPEIAVVVDLEGTIPYLNRVEKGYDRELVLGMHASAIMLPESQAIFSAALDSVRKTGTGATEGKCHEVRAHRTHEIDRGHLEAGHT